MSFKVEGPWGDLAPHYYAEQAREETEVREKAKVEAEEVADIFRTMD